MYSRTGKPYTLDEVIYIGTQLILGMSLEEIALQVRRDPKAVKYKFLQHRAKRKDGSYSYKTVKNYQALQE